MEDNQILALYWARDERALAATEEKYGRYCYTIAYHILTSHEDAQESVNDTWLHAWQRIPPHQPSVLATFLGKLTRRISLNRWRDTHRLKRGGGEVALALGELSDCLSTRETAETALAQRELTRALGAFLAALPDTERDVFVSRYWYLADIRKISGCFGFTESKVKSMLLRTREKLRKFLLKEGLL